MFAVDTEDNGDGEEKKVPKGMLSRNDKGKTYGWGRRHGRSGPVRVYQV